MQGGGGHICRVANPWRPRRSPRIRVLTVDPPPCATSLRCSRSTICSPTRTPPRGGCPPMPVTAMWWTSCLAPTAVCCPRVRSRSRSRDVRWRRRCGMTSTAISRVTNLLAVVSAPSLNTATIRHIEVLELQPQVVMVVVITSTGGVSKMLTTFDVPVDPGLVGMGRRISQRAARGLRSRRPHALQAP